MNQNQYDYLDKYKKYIETFGMNREEVNYFLLNYHDAVAFNDYLSSKYLEFDFNSDEYLSKLIQFFESNNIEQKIAKEILISTPLILSCKNPETDLKIIYKGNEIEGIIIYDENGNCHPYRKTKKLRSIMQNYSFLEDLKMNELNDKDLGINKYNKRFYVINDYKNIRKR